MGRTAYTEPQCLYNGALYLYGPIFKSQEVREGWDPIGCPETSLNNNPRRITFQKERKISFTSRRKPEIALVLASFLAFLQGVYF
jgi:hypothetical protein